VRLLTVAAPPRREAYRGRVVAASYRETLPVTKGIAQSHRTFGAATS